MPDIADGYVTFAAQQWEHCGSFTGDGAVGRHLRQFQPVALQATTATRDLGFVALLILLTSWPDVTRTHLV